jgi:hypothetical protein
LRRLVREVLKQALQERQPGAAGPPTAPPSNMIERMRQAAVPGGTGVVDVDGDLNRFARECIQAAAHEDLKAAIMTGKLTFRQAHAAASPAPRPDRAPTAGASFSVNNGILNEVRIEEIGRQCARIVLGPDVVVTPLARDRARELKLELIRTKP